MAQDTFELLGTTVAFFLALLFLRAGVHKLGDRDRFRGILGAYAILPARTLTAAVFAIGVLELATAILLLVPMARGLGATLASALLALYALAMASALVRGHYLIDCGCGESPETVSWLLVARNTVLAALAAPTATGLTGRGTSLAADASALAIGMLVFVLWLAALAMFANTRRINETLPSATQWSTP